jgi:hypothetical protein
LQLTLAVGRPFTGMLLVCYWAMIIDAFLHEVDTTIDFLGNFEVLIFVIVKAQ